MTNLLHGFKGVFQSDKIWLFIMKIKTFLYVSGNKKSIIDDMDIWINIWWYEIFFSTPWLHTLFIYISITWICYNNEPGSIYAFLFKLNLFIAYFYLL